MPTVQGKFFQPSQPSQPAGGGFFGSLFAPFQPGQPGQPDQYGYVDPMANLGPIDRYKYLNKYQPATLMALASGLMSGDLGGGLANAGQEMQQYKAWDEKHQDAQNTRNATYQWLIEQGYSPADAQAAMMNPAILSDILNPKQNYLAVGDNVFNTQTGEWSAAPGAGGGGLFTGKGVDAQALNYLISIGKLTMEQAAEVAAGKTITDPSDGSIWFKTPGDLVGGGGQVMHQPADGSPAQPVDPSGGSSPAGGEAGAGGGSVAGPPAPRSGVQLTPAKPVVLTEFQRKSKELHSVAAPELQTALKNYDALTSIGSQLVEAAKSAPYVGGLVNVFGQYAQTKEYQSAKQAVRTIVQSYLYSTSGATANPGEVATLTESLMPKPGAKNIDEMKQRLSRMVDAIKIAAETGQPVSPIDSNFTVRRVR